MNSVVLADSLSVTKQDHEILQGMSFEIKPGAIVGLLGPSGAGKTTLIRSIVGLQKITSGQVSVLGQPAGSNKLRGRIGYMAQNSAIYDDLTVEQNIDYFAKVLGIASVEALQIIQQVELTEHKKQLVASLSGGQRTRVSLAIALLGNPKLLLLDEPTVGLDPRLRRELWQGFHSLSRQGVTVLVSSHVMDEAKLCDELLLIQDGAIIYHNSPQALCAATKTDDVEDAFLKLTEVKV